MKPRKSWLFLHRMQAKFLKFRMIFVVLINFLAFTPNHSRSSVEKISGLTNSQWPSVVAEALLFEQVRKKNLDFLLESF